jgi:hypothetical protein
MVFILVSLYHTSASTLLANAETKARICVKDKKLTTENSKMQVAAVL